LKEADDKIDYILGGGYSSAKRPDLAAEHRVLRHSPVDLWHAQVGAAHYDGDRYTKKLFCWEQFLAMAFTQLVSRESLRDIEACLGAIGPSCITWALAPPWRVPPWPTPTRTAIGASLLTLRRWKRAKGCYPSGHSAKYLA